jgi:hypothetical protein
MLATARLQLSIPSLPGLLFGTMLFKPIALALLQFGLVIAAPIDWENKRALPTPVSVATAKIYLAGLTVEAESNSPA